jgi:hypothetical protein
VRLQIDALDGTVAADRYPYAAESNRQTRAGILCDADDGSDLIRRRIELRNVAFGLLEIQPPAPMATQSGDPGMENFASACNSDIGYCNSAGEGYKFAPQGELVLPDNRIIATFGKSGRFSPGQDNVRSTHGHP